jgi:hypothetical protein
MNDGERGARTESVPLRPGLCVDVDDLVEGSEAERFQVFKCMFGLFTREPGFGHALERPALLSALVLASRALVGGEEGSCLLECDTLPGADFLLRFFGVLSSKEVQRAAAVPLPVLVPYSPRGSRRHAGDGRQVLEIGKILGAHVEGYYGFEVWRRRRLRSGGKLRGGS